ncbi:MAG: tRNA glutamyl-Q(34) synthetase GluQRS [Acidobacteria bacterium]|nr:tRNA glutamyl-Q(34) synthetase GluQRS [Acidobacteriota bacterium]
MMPLRPDLSALSSRLTETPVTRFAPSPTGYLHLGHVVNALYVWGIAGALGGRVLLRIEDHDRRRTKIRFEESILDDLDWLGFVPDAGRSPVVRQSDRPARYEDALERLRRSHHVYGCDCSRRVIGSERYGNTCRNRDLETGPGVGARVEMGPGSERFWDGTDEREEAPAAFGDLLIRDREGHWTYQFSVVVDDEQDGVNLVIRGADLTGSTARQIRLGRMLGRSTPAQFFHHPLLLDPSGRKLSKSDGDVGVREMRAAGASAPEVLGRAAVAAGLRDFPHPLRAIDVVLLFG